MILTHSQLLWSYTNTQDFWARPLKFRGDWKEEVSAIWSHLGIPLFLNGTSVRSVAGNGGCASPSYSSALTARHLQKDVRKWQKMLACPFSWSPCTWALLLSQWTCSRVWMKGMLGHSLRHWKENRGFYEQLHANKTMNNLGKVGKALEEYAASNPTGE